MIYAYKCPYLACNFKGQGLQKHLTRHGWSHNQAKLETSCRLKMMKYLLPSPGQRKGISKPKVCTHCIRCYMRIDVHKKYCNSENDSCAPIITVIEKDIETTRTNYGSVAVVEPNKRGSFMSISTEASDPIFNMKNATLLTPIQKKAHGLKDRSNFMYIHKNSEDFLNDFSDWLAI